MKLFDSTADKDLNHNFLVNIIDGAFFGWGVGFTSYTTIIPLFVSTLTSSAMLIGLIPAIHNMGWQLPQLYLQTDIKNGTGRPYVIRATIHERLPIVGAGCRCTSFTPDWVKNRPNPYIYVADLAGFGFRIHR